MDGMGLNLLLLVLTLTLGPERQRAVSPLEGFNLVR
jgi:hypothetical protein